MSHQCPATFWLFLKYFIIIPSMVICDQCSMTFVLWCHKWLPEKTVNLIDKCCVKIGVTFVFFFFGSTKVWTQGLLLARQTLTAWGTPPAHCATVGAEGDEGKERAYLVISKYICK
jgi:hypothetical protein